jgi:acyl-CoA thioester hydrolase
MRKVTTDITVRFSDIDAMGHVNNAVYLTYFEEGRKAFLGEAVGIVHPADYPFILARTVCDFVKPIRLEDRVALDVWISGIGKKASRSNTSCAAGTVRFTAGANRSWLCTITEAGKPYPYRTGSWKGSGNIPNDPRKPVPRSYN